MTNCRLTPSRWYDYSPRDLWHAVSRRPRRWLRDHTPTNAYQDPDIHSILAEKGRPFRVIWTWEGPVTVKYTTQGGEVTERSGSSITFTFHRDPIESL